MNCALNLLPDGSVAVQTPYHERFIYAFKAQVPVTDRTWDKNRRVWLITTSYAPQVAALIDQYFGQQVAVPLVTGDNQPRQYAVQLDYVGSTKIRPDGSASAFGLVNGEWSLVFPETVLIAWFSGTDPATMAAEPEKPAGPPTLYSTLGLGRQATDDQIKTAYRRLAKQWHPDVCREPGAADMFVSIKRAYDLLSNSLQRRKYDAALKLEELTARHERDREASERRFSVHVRSVFGAANNANGYRSPLRCGMLLVEGSKRLDRIVVSKILHWQDITRSDGKTMVASWEDDRVVVKWV